MKMSGEKKKKTDISQSETTSSCWYVISDVTHFEVLLQAVYEASSRADDQREVVAILSEGLLDATAEATEHQRHINKS